MDATSRWRASVTWAQVGITVQFLALLRNLIEYFRLRQIRLSVLDPARTITIGSAEPYVVGALITACLCWLAVTLYFFKLYRLVVAVTVLTVAALLVYRFGFMG